MREEAILHAMCSGDTRGLEALMDHYIPYVSTVVWNILRGAMPPEDAEEVVSDVFLAAWNQAGDLEPGHVKGWLGAVARNKAKNKLRQMGQALSLEEDVLELPGPDGPSEALEREEERALVRRAVDALPLQEQEIFLRHYYYAQTTKEISLRMGLKEATIKTKLRRGRIKLKEALTREGLVYET